MPNLTGTITATAAAAGTALAINGAARIRSIRVNFGSVTGATNVVITAYDNNVAASVTTAAGATWPGGRSPAFVGPGPGTVVTISHDKSTGRHGNQAGQTPPNSAGVKSYWPVDTSTGAINYAGAPTTKTAGPFSADGNGTFQAVDMTDNEGTSFPAVTAAPVVFTGVINASQASITFIPDDNFNVAFGVNIVAAATGATAIVATYAIDYLPLP